MIVFFLMMLVMCLLSVLTLNPLFFILGIAGLLFASKQNEKIQAAGQVMNLGCLPLVMVLGLLFLLGSIAMVGEDKTYNALHGVNQQLDATCQQVQADRRSKWTGPAWYENAVDCNNKVGDGR